MLVERHLLLGGVLTPLTYFALLFAAGAFYPDFSHVRQVASELGADGAPYGGALAFNAGIVLVGLVGVGAAFGLFADFRKSAVARRWPSSQALPPHHLL